MDFRNRNARILNITHCDLDGAVSGIIVKRFYVDCEVYVTNYGESCIRKTLAYIEYVKQHIDGIVFTDFSPVEYKDALDATGIPYIILDHHKTALPLNNPKIGHIVNTKFCGAKLAYLFYSRFAPELSCLEELVELTNDYDMWKHEDRRSKFLNIVYWTYYGFDSFYERFRTGFNGFTENERKELRKYYEQFKQVWDNLLIVDLPDNGCLCSASDFISEIGLKLEELGYKWYVIYNDNSNKIHLRSRTDSIDMADICTNVLKRGGGHAQAASCACEPEELEELMTKISDYVSKLP